MRHGGSGVFLSTYQKCVECTGSGQVYLNLAPDRKKLRAEALAKTLAAKK
jgi:hypothetical protein